MRRVTTICPPHFTTISFDCPNQDQVLAWIYENLEGRFYFDHARNYESDTLIGLLSIDQMLVGFELSREAVMFGLQIDIITR